jgi:hypothetical protein
MKTKISYQAKCFAELGRSIRVVNIFAKADNQFYFLKRNIYDFGSKKSRK